MKRNKDLKYLNLITGNEGKFRLSEDIIVEFEKAILNDINVKPANRKSYYISRLFFRIWKYLLRSESLLRLFIGLYSLFCRRRNYMVVLMGPRFPKCFPHFFTKGRKSVYMFDAWPLYHRNIIKFISDFNVDFLFVSSKQSAEILNKIIGKNNVIWVPEGVDADEYKFYSIKEKHIDILSFGRNYELFHEKIVNILSTENVNYIFPEEGKLVFADKNLFIEGLAKTKISVCFPTNLTHNERAGEIETMTNRYLQSMASKCLVLGKAPAEMIELFGYNPVVEVNMDEPANQIIEILANFDSYTELIEKNYKMVVNHHTWCKRWESISTIISEKQNQKNNK
jgi:glycosyltransferase involved in cell wall biosynthesis